MDLLKKHDYEIVGSMTDSIIFWRDPATPLTMFGDNILKIVNRPHKWSWLKKSNTAGITLDEAEAQLSRVPTWKLEASGTSIISRGVGQYSITGGEKSVHRHQGKSRPFTREELLVKKETPLRLEKTKLFMETVVPIYIIVEGKAGYGKSHYIKESYDDTWVRTAYTALAANEIGGKTINSLFNLEIGNLTTDESLNKISLSKKRLFQQASGLIIDEYYTLPNDVASKMSEVLKFVRCCSLPFGGMNVVFVGDSRQTRAVGEGYVDSSEFCKILKVAKKKELIWTEKSRLTKQYDKYCCKFRVASRKSSSIIKLLDCPKFSNKPVDGFFVYYTNEEVAKKNISMLGVDFSSIKLEERDNIKWDINYIRENMSKLKKDMPLMIINNYRYLSNGMIVKYVSHNETHITILVSNNGQKREATIKQSNIFFRLAYAITIHKAQCRTFKGINITINKKDLRISEVTRLLYTALTRVRDFSACHIKVIE
jgi:hypothetical protein